MEEPAQSVHRPISLKLPPSAFAQFARISRCIRGCDTGQFRCADARAGTIAAAATTPHLSHSSIVRPPNSQRIRGARCSSGRADYEIRRQIARTIQAVRSRRHRRHVSRAARCARFNHRKVHCANTAIEKARRAKPAHSG